jgi:hypothetical protein
MEGIARKLVINFIIPFTCVCREIYKEISLRNRMYILFERK